MRVMIEMKARTQKFVVQIYCPWCGSEEVVVDKVEDDGETRIEVWVCLNCEREFEVECKWEGPWFEMEVKK